MSEDAEVIETLEDLEYVWPPVKLTGSNGNAVAVVTACKKAARTAGLKSQKELDRLRDEMLSGDYNHVLQTAMKYFDVH